MRAASMRARRWLAVIGRAASPSETARVNIIPQVRDEVKCPPAQVFLDQEFAFLYIGTMFPYSERSCALTNFCQGDTRLGIGMSKTRKSGNRSGETPSTRNRLS